MRIIYLSAIFFIAYCLLLTANCFSQTSNFIHYGVADGLVQSQVSTIEQDKDGNLWIGTLAGLSKYNGKEFKTYTKKDGLAEDWITTSYTDRSGNIWFGHYGGNVTKYNYEKKIFEDVHFKQYSQFNPITDILEDHAGNFWFAKKGSGIYKYEPDSNIIIAVSDTPQLNSPNVYSICEDKFGNLWFGTNKGITIYNPKYDINSPDAFVYLNDKNGLPANVIFSIKSVLNDEIWIGTWTSGIIVIRTTDNIYDLIKASESEGEALSADIISNIKERDGLASNNVLSIYEDKDNNIWVGSLSKGITRYLPASSSERKQDAAKGTYKIFSMKKGLFSYAVDDILQDREGNIWIASDMGLDKYRGDRFVTFDESTGLINNIVWSILEDSKGNIWMGTDGGVSRFTFEKIKDKKRLSGNFKIKNYTSGNGLSGDFVVCIYEDSKGNLWFSTVRKGVCVFDGKKFRNYNTNDGLIDNVVSSIIEDNDSNIWFATYKGATRFNPQKQKYTNYTIENGLGGNKVHTSFKDSKGNLWFGIVGGDLTKYDGTKFQKFSEKDGIKHRFVKCITEDLNNNLWFATYANGLYKYDGQNFTNYTIRGVKGSDFPWLITCDKENNIWIGISQGVVKFDQQTNVFTFYGKQEGFLGVETNQNAVLNDSEGNIWFGTIMGAVKYSPEKDIPNKTEPKTFVNKLQLFHKDIEFQPDAQFSYDQNQLTFNFIGVSLTNPNKVRYQYKLEGFDKDWSHEIKENFVTYTNLPPGAYSFMVRSCNNDGVWNKEPASYSFTITPPFWGTWWFYSLCAVAALSGVITFIKVRERNFTRSKKLLEQRVAERTKQLQEQKEIVEEKNKDITDSIRYAQQIQQAIFPPDSYVKKLLPNSFIYLKPQAIVSGDFYWLTKVDQNIIFAAVDCTGHGVPGAFISLLCHDSLNQAVREHGIIKPSDILNDVDSVIQETFKYKETIRDGMDIALCSIDVVNGRAHSIKYAGAYNPLYIVRNRELIVTEADRFSIGGFLKIKDHRFTNHERALKKGDMIYIFSDGYQDQLGGKNDRKFMKGSFRELLLEISSLSLDKQKIALDKNIEKWMGKQEQTDDILVMGVRI
ncbi:MAG: SpoIIE family protein phosphatase [Cytophagales bacterium]|nr:SpoIIE family protein phosphatase [Cytophagales bacterium]